MKRIGTVLSLARAPGDFTSLAASGLRNVCNKFIPMIEHDRYQLTGHPFLLHCYSPRVPGAPRG
jgi:hypothetical protein